MSVLNPPLKLPTHSPKHQQTPLLQKCDVEIMAARAASLRGNEIKTQGQPPPLFFSPRWGLLWQHFRSSPGWMGSHILALVEDGEGKKMLSGQWRTWLFWNPPDWFFRVAYIICDNAPRGDVSQRDGRDSVAGLRVISRRTVHAAGIHVSEGQDGTHWLARPTLTRIHYFFME